MGTESQAETDALYRGDVIRSILIVTSEPRGSVVTGTPPRTQKQMRAEVGSIRRPIAEKNHYGFLSALAERHSSFQSFSVWSA